MSILYLDDKGRDQKTNFSLVVWNGFASSNLIGVLRSARRRVKKIEEFLEVTI